MELVSIIVPIYKVEELLDRCVNSLVSQSYKALEIILVDDGSPDKCPELCEQWAKKDGRIKVVHKTNGGLSSARNAGLQVAGGEYIIFVDSDDWLREDFVQKLYETLKNEDADVVECEVIKTYGEAPIDNSKGDVKVYSAEDALKLLISDSVFHQHVWNKIYKKSAIGDLIFAVGKLNEDEFFTYRVFGESKKIVKISDKMYYYFQRPGSIMGQGYNIRRLDALEAKVIRQEYIDKKYPRLSSAAKVNLYNSIIYSGQMTLKYLSGEDREKAQAKQKELSRKFYPTKDELGNADFKTKLWIKLSRVSFFGLCRLKNVLKKGI